MKKKSETYINDNGSYTIKTVRTKTGEDGFVPQREMYSNKINTYGKTHKGYSKTTSYSTNNPKITRPFVYGITGIFLIIGIFLCFLPDFMSKCLGVFFIVLSIYVVKTAKKDIDRIENELKKKNSQNDVYRDQDLKR